MLRGLFPRRRSAAFLPAPFAFAVGAALFPAPPAIAAAADDPPPLAPYHADGHAPIGVMGDHVHGAGEVMLAYRNAPMWMSGLRDGTHNLSTEETLRVDNPFSGAPMQPPKLRLVPREMTMQMHMFGVMYAPADRVTLMAMGMAMVKEMTLETFRPDGTPLDTFSTRTSGLGDSSLGALVRLTDGPVRSHLILGAGLPTGSRDATGEALLPNGRRREVRLPYAMQLGTGTWALQPGLVVQTKRGRNSVGGQVGGVFRLGGNDDGYRHGHRQEATVWFMHEPTPAIALTARLAGTREGAISGRDPNIAGPVPTADPDNYGGRRLEAFVGINLAGQSGFLREHRLALEAAFPLYQALNGPQMPRTWRLLLGWQRAWKL